MPYRVVNTELIADGAITAAKMADHVLPGRVFEATPNGLAQAAGRVDLTPVYDPDSMWDGEDDYLIIKRAGLYVVNINFMGISGLSPNELVIKSHLGYTAYAAVKGKASFGDLECMNLALLRPFELNATLAVIAMGSMDLNTNFDNRVIIAQLR